MNVNDIIIKTQLETNEMEFVIEEYIFEKKNVRVKINHLNHPLIRIAPEPIKSAVIQQQLNLLNTAYQDACVYFFDKQNNEKQ